MAIALVLQEMRAVDRERQPMLERQSRQFAEQELANLNTAPKCRLHFRLISNFGTRQDLLKGDRRELFIGGRFFVQSLLE